MNNIFDIMNDHVNGASFVTLTINTEHRMNKTIPNDKWVEGGTEPKRVANPHFGRVRKVTEGMNVMVFQNKNTNAYDNMVKRRLVKEGKDPSTFELGERAWGVRLPKTPFIEHKGQHYLEIICMKAGTTTYLLDDQPISLKDIQGNPPTQKKPNQGGLSDKVEVRTVKIASIVSINVDKESYSNLMFEK